MSKVSGRLILPMRMSNPPQRDSRCQPERPAILVNHLVGQAKGLMNLAASKVGLDAQIGVANDVEVGFAGQPQRLGDAATACVFKVDDQVGVVARMFGNS